MDVTGIIIRSADYGEKDRIITIASPEGIFSVKAKGVRSPKSKLKAFTGVLSFGEFTLINTKAGYTLSGANIEESFYNCWSDPDKYTAAMACLEIYEKCAERGDNVSVVSLLKALKNINYGEFYPLAETLRYGTCCAAETGIDVTEGVFPGKICDVFSALIKCDSVEEVLTEYEKEDVNTFLRHLAAGFRSELGIKLTVCARLS